MTSVVHVLSGADLERLGFRPDDAADFHALVDRLPADPERLARVEALVERFRSQIGQFFLDDYGVRDHHGLATFDDGLVTMLAMVAVADDAHAEYLRRGVPSEIAWGSLADLGQQVHIFRKVFGFFGLFAQWWCAENFSGRHLWLGRLQFTLERDDDGYFLGVHIPESGPLTPEAVDDSLALAREIGGRGFAEYRPERFMLHSWLLDPGIADELHPDSNFVRFARRFEITEESHPGWHDGLFFGFHIEPSLRPVDLSALPCDTSLHRAILRLFDGDGVHVRVGRLR